MGDYTGDYYKVKVFKGDTRSLDCGTYRSLQTIIQTQPQEEVRFQVPRDLLQGFEPATQKRLSELYHMGPSPKPRLRMLNSKSSSSVPDRDPLWNEPPVSQPRKWQSPEVEGPQYESQNAIIFILGALKTVLLALEDSQLPG